MANPKETTLRALRSARGDDLERATAAFKGMTDEQLDTEYGESGQTCRQILEGYQKHRDRVDEAIAWVEKQD